MNKSSRPRKLFFKVFDEAKISICVAAKLTMGSYLKIVRKEVNTMKLPGGMDLGSMMRQAEEMQEKMARGMKETVGDATAGGGAITVKMRGDFQVVELKISPDIVKEGDVDMIQDLTVAALGEAHRKVEESLKGKLGGMLPPGLI